MAKIPGVAGLKKIAFRLFAEQHVVPIGEVEIEACEAGSCAVTSLLQ